MRRTLAWPLVVALVAALCLVAAPRAAAEAGGATSALAEPVAPQPSTAYWMAGSDGSVYAFRSPALGSLSGIRLTKPVVGMAATPSGRGYWLVAADGAVFTYGDAPFYGSRGGLALNRPIVGMAATPTGGGYWLVADDGGIFTYGDAGFQGSTGGLRLNRPIKGMASTASGDGYRLVADDGGIFTFGNASFAGSTGGVRLNRPIVGMAATPFGDGYWLVADDGGIFTFGEAPFLGSAGAAQLNRPIVGMAASPTRQGYTLVASDGGIFTYGDAHFAGSTAGQRLPGPIVGMAVDVSPQLFVPGQRGYDISWPQCGGPYPPRPFEISVVGVNNGRPFTTNPCFVDQATRWASPDRLDVYINLNRPPPGYTGGCGATDADCIATSLGREAALSSLATVRANGLGPRIWWLDIEGPDRWYAETRLNSLIIQAAVDALEREGLTVGLYGTRYQWNVITGGYATRAPLPLWAAGIRPLQRCNEPFGGGYVVLSQVIGEATASGFDENYAC